MKVYDKQCVEAGCGVQLRPGKTDPALWPGTVRAGSHGRCVNCDARVRRAQARAAAGNPPRAKAVRAAAPRKPAKPKPAPVVKPRPKPSLSLTDPTILAGAIPAIDDAQVAAITRMVRKRRYPDGDDLIAMLTGVTP